MNLDCILFSLVLDDLSSKGKNHVMFSNCDGEQ